MYHLLIIETTIKAYYSLPQVSKPFRKKRERGGGQTDIVFFLDCGNHFKSSPRTTVELKINLCMIDSLHLLIDPLMIPGT